jgi:hypothetical protein
MNFFPQLRLTSALEINVIQGTDSSGMRASSLLALQREFLYGVSALI